MKDEVVNRVVSIAGLRPHPRNYNAHSDAQVGDLRASLSWFGQVRSIVVQAKPSPRPSPSKGEGGFLIVAGHGLVAAARLEGYTQLRADVIPAAWKPARVLAYLAVDNELARQGTPDEAQLAAIVAELAAANETELARLAAGNAARLKELLGVAAEPGSADDGMTALEKQIRDKQRNASQVIFCVGMGTAWLARDDRITIVEKILATPQANEAANYAIEKMLEKYG